MKLLTPLLQHLLRPPLHLRLLTPPLLHLLPLLQHSQRMRRLLRRHRRQQHQRRHQARMTGHRRNTGCSKPTARRST